MPLILIREIKYPRILPLIEYLNYYCSCPSLTYQQSTSFFYYLSLHRLFHICICKPHLWNAGTNSQNVREQICVKLKCINCLKFKTAKLKCSDIKVFYSSLRQLGHINRTQEIRPVRKAPSREME